MPTFSLAQKHAELDTHNAKLLIRIAKETQTSDLPITSRPGATAGGDERKLRGIPTIARGVAGAIPGTSPHRIRHSE
jgi:hypothetical protein